MKICKRKRYNICDILQTLKGKKHKVRGNKNQTMDIPNM